MLDTDQTVAVVYLIQVGATEQRQRLLFFTCRHFQIISCVSDNHKIARAPGPL